MEMVKIKKIAGRWNIVCPVCKKWVRLRFLKKQDHTSCLRFCDFVIDQEKQKIKSPNYFPLRQRRALLSGPCRFQSLSHEIREPEGYEDSGTKFISLAEASMDRRSIEMK
jgi:hypothetical protein